MKYPYTKIPNWYFDLLPSLTDCESRILQVIMRKTYGWSKTTDKISYSQFIELSGLKNRSSVSKGLKGLTDRGIIQKTAKRITAQEVTIVPIESTIFASQLVHEMDSVSPLNGLPVVHEMDSQKTGLKKPFKDTNMAAAAAWSGDQESARLLLVEYGFDSEDSILLVRKAWANSRDISYIQDLWGYVASHSKENPLGYFRYMLERNKVQEVSSKAYENAANSPNQFQASKYQHGGKYHFMASHNCPRCHPEMRGSDYSETGETDDNN